RHGYRSTLHLTPNHAYLPPFECLTLSVSPWAKRTVASVAAAPMQASSQWKPPSTRTTTVGRAPPCGGGAAAAVAARAATAEQRSVSKHPLHAACRLAMVRTLATSP